MAYSAPDAALDFINRSPTCYHAAANTAAVLDAAGYRRLDEDAWALERGGRYYLLRDGGVLAFRIPEREFRGFLIAAAHSDSPTFKLRQAAELPPAGGCIRLGVEPYGGAIWRAWLDRPLTAAGRAVVRTGNRLVSRLVWLDRDLLIIPSLAIHMDREVNSGTALKPQTDLPPVFALAGEGEADGGFRRLLAAELDAAPEDVLSTDLFLVPRTPAVRLGAQGEFLAGPRLDDLLCGFACLRGFLDAAEGGNLPVLALFNHEEVGSGTREGAASPFLSDALERIARQTGTNPREAFLVSADNAHAVHPAHPEYADSREFPVLGGGVAVKYNANQRYITDAVSDAVFREVCRAADVPVQRYSNRADLPGGSTLGHLAAARLGIRGVDVGLPQLAMHSAYELAAASDVEGLIRAMSAYYSRTLRETPAGITLES